MCRVDGVVLICAITVLKSNCYNRDAGSRTVLISQNKPNRIRVSGNEPAHLLLYFIFTQLRFLPNDVAIRSNRSTRPARIVVTMILCLLARPLIVLAPLLTTQVHLSELCKSSLSAV